MELIVQQEENFTNYHKILIFGDRLVGKSSLIKMLNESEITSNYNYDDDLKVKFYNNF